MSVLSKHLFSLVDVPTGSPALYIPPAGTSAIVLTLLAYNGSGVDSDIQAVYNNADGSQVQIWGHDPLLPAFNTYPGPTFVIEDGESVQFSANDDGWQLFMSGMLQTA